MAPAAKRRKTQPERYPCHTCFSTRTSSQFPTYNPTETCDHLINTCKSCLKQWVESQIESSVFTPHIPCPQCDEVMNGRDVEMAVAKKVFVRYVELERRYIAENTPGWRWCLAPKCQAGQVHESIKAEEEGEGEGPEEKPQLQTRGRSASDPSPSKKKNGAVGWLRRSVRAALGPPDLDQQSTSTSTPTPKAPKPKPKPKPQRKPDICTCADCGARACVPCDRPWHDGETCEQYQVRIKDRLEEEDATLAAIEKQTKKCPKCAKSIEKNGGCRHMFCTQCRSEFCWNCVQPINNGGRYCGCANAIPVH